MESKIKDLGKSDVVRAMVEEYRSNHPHMQSIKEERETHLLRLQQLDNIEKTYIELRERNWRLAESMCSAFIENHKDELKNKISSARMISEHLELVSSKTKISIEEAGEIYLAVVQQYVKEKEETAKNDNLKSTA